MPVTTACDRFPSILVTTTIVYAFGVGHPGDKNLMERYVLQDFAKDEWLWVEALCDIVSDNVGLLIEGKDSTFQNKVHLAMKAKGFGDDERAP